MNVNDTSDTSELTVPMPRLIETVGKDRMSSWMRWSGLSTAALVYRPLW
jgi:hypothetical protein